MISKRSGADNVIEGQRGERKAHDMILRSLGGIIPHVSDKANIVLHRYWVVCIIYFAGDMMTHSSGALLNPQFTQFTLVISTHNISI